MHTHLRLTFALSLITVAGTVGCSGDSDEGTGAAGATGSTTSAATGAGGAGGATGAGGSGGGTSTTSASSTSSSGQGGAGGAPVVYELTEGTAACLLYGSPGFNIIDGSASSSGDYGYAELPAGFGFAMAGEPIRGVIASQAGVARLVAESEPFSANQASFSLSGTPSALPSSPLGDLVIAPLWSDLQGSGTAAVEMSEAGGRVVILWKGWRLVSGQSLLTVAFEVQLGTDGGVELHYCDGFDLADADASLSYTIGVQAKSAAVTAAEVQHVPLAGRSFRIAPN